MAEKSRDAPFSPSPAAPAPPPTAAADPLSASFIRVRTELCKHLTMPGLEKLLMEESQPLLQPPVTPRDGFPARTSTRFSLFSHSFLREPHGSVLGSSRRALPNAHISFFYSNSALYRFFSFLFKMNSAKNPCPAADFAFALHANTNNGVHHDDSNGEASAAAKSTRQLPQAIAHRGYKAKFPENTMAAFSGAVDVGAHAIETDVHLSKDGVVVLSHDPSLERCFGRKEKIIDCDWEFLSTLRTKAKAGQPSEPMPRLSDLLEFMTKPGNENLWVLLDIKVRFVNFLFPLMFPNGGLQFGPLENPLYFPVERTNGLHSEITI